VARGDRVFVPHYEPPKRHGSRVPFTFIDYKSNSIEAISRLAWYQEFQKVDPGVSRGTTC
jgi:hypothetical protein